MSHPFGDLLSQYLHRKHGLSQAKLAGGILQDPSIITKMCKGQRLNGSQARTRMVAIVGWLRSQGAIARVEDANALLDAAGLAPLRADHAAEHTLLQQFPPRTLPLSPPVAAPTGTPGRAYDNLRAALDWCEADEAGAEFQLRLVGALGRFWFIRGYLWEGRSRLVSALARQGPWSPHACALALNWAGNLARLCNHPAHAQELLEEGLPLARGVGDRRLLCQLMRHLAFTLLDQGEVEGAQLHLEDGLMIAESLEAAQRSGDALTVMASLHTAGLSAMLRGDYQAAHAFSDQGLAIAQREEVGTQGLGILHVKERLAIAESDLRQARQWDREWFNRAYTGRGFELTPGLLLAGSIAVAEWRYQLAAGIVGAAGAVGHGMTRDQAVELALAEGDRESLV